MKTLLPVLGIASLIVLGGWAASIAFQKQNSAVQPISSLPTNVVTASSATPSQGNTIDSLPLQVQEFLNFVPQGHKNKMADYVEVAFGYAGWVGSDSIPGAFRVVPASHGASNIYWTLKMKKGGVLNNMPPLTTTATVSASDNYINSTSTNPQPPVATAGHTYTVEFWISQDGTILRPENTLAGYVNMLAS